MARITPAHLVNFGAVAFCVAVVLLYTFRESVVGTLTREDGLVEWGTALLYFAAAGLFLWMAVKAPHAGWYWRLGLAAIVFLVAAEEISWGQRLIGFGTPATMQETNVQQEFNFHNLEGIHGNIRMIGLLFVGFVAFAMPVADWAIPQVRQLLVRFAVPVFPMRATLLVGQSMLMMVYPRLVSGEVIFATDEVAELLLAAAFFWYALRTWELRSAATPAVASKTQTPRAGVLVSDP